MTYTLAFQIKASADDSNAARQDLTTYPPPNNSSINQNTSQYVNPKKNFYPGGVGGPGGAQYYTNTLFMRWDTSSIEDSHQVINAQLWVVIGSAGVVDNLNLNMEWYSWTPPLSDATDYVETPGTTALSFPMSQIPYVLGGPANAAYTFNLSNPQNVNKSGFTGIRFGLSAVNPPTGSNECYFYAWDDTTYEPPTLLVTLAPPIPKVATAPMRSRW